MVLLLMSKDYYLSVLNSVKMTSQNKMAAGRSDVTVPEGMSQSGYAAGRAMGMKRVGDTVGQPTAVTTSPSASVAAEVPASVPPDSRVSAGDDAARSGNGSRSVAQSSGTVRQKLDQFRPVSTSSVFCRASTVGGTTSRSSGTPSTLSFGSNSADLRRAAAVNDGSGRLQTESATDHSYTVSPSDCRFSEFRSAAGETPPVQELARSLATFPSHSSQIQRTSMMNTNDSRIHLQTAKSNGHGDYRPHRSVTSSSDDNEKTVVRTSTSSAMVDSPTSSACHASTAGHGLSKLLSVNFDSRASASPQLRRWSTRPECGGQSSSTAQAGRVDHHHHRQLQQPLSHATKPHSVPCSPRLQARLATTQPWRPWSPSTSGGLLACPVQTAGSVTGQSDPRSSVDISQLASSLLLTKIIRDRQEEETTHNLKSRGKLYMLDRKSS